MIDHCQVTDAITVCLLCALQAPSLPTWATLWWTSVVSLVTLHTQIVRKCFLQVGCNSGEAEILAAKNEVSIE